LSGHVESVSVSGHGRVGLGFVAGLRAI